MTKINGI